MSDANPFVDPGLFGFVYLDDVFIACTLIEVDGAAKPEEWQITKGSGSDGATAAWKGTKLAEKLKLKFRATDAASYNAMTAMRDQVRPKLGQKPPSLNITNEIINWAGISKIRLVEPAFPKWEAINRAWEFEWEFGEHAPSKQTTTGASDPAKPESAGGGAGGKQSPAEKELAEAIKEAKSL